MLLAGNLFHTNGPPKGVLKEAMKLLRKYCFGYREIDFELTSDQSKNFADSDIPLVNYEDPNVNVSLPVFPIHGSHDGPVSFYRESVAKFLSTAGLINYFGHIGKRNIIELEPLLFKKNRLRLLSVV